MAWIDEESNLWGAAWPFGQGPAEPTEDVKDPDRAGKIDSEETIGRHEWAILLEWLAQSPHGLLGHNVKFDVLHVAGHSKRGYPGRNLNGYVRFDSMVAAREFWAKEPAALKTIATRLFEADADAEQRALKPYLGPKTNPRYDLVPWEVMRPYAVQDAVLTLRTYLVQDPLWLEGHYGAHFLGSEIAICAALTRLELAGIPFDAESSRGCAAELHSQIAKLSEELPFEPKKAKDYYFASADEPLDLGKGQVTPLGLPAYQLTDGGKPSLTADVVDQMVREKQPFAEQLQKINRYKSANSKWYEPFAARTGPDGRMRTSFRQVASTAEAPGGTRSGRFALPVDSPVAAAHGWKPIGELQIGDEIFGSDGRITRVVDIPFEGLARVWEVEFSDGTTIECSDNHLWQIRDRSYRDHNEVHVVTTKMLSQRDLAGCQLFIPTTAPVQYQGRKPRIDPYVLGVLIGNGDIMKSPRFSVFEEDLDIVDQFSARCADQVNRGTDRGDRCVRYGLVGGKTRAALSRYGLTGHKAHDKFIPRRYLHLSESQRWDLLRGLMDTDGSADHRSGAARYDTVSYQLALDVQELVQSLGGLARVRKYQVPKATSDCYTVSVSAPQCPFFTKRKAVKWRKPTKSVRRIMSVRETNGHAPMRCITVGAPDGLFLTSGYVVTHNSAGRINLQAVPQDFHLHLPVPSPRKLIARAVKQQCPGWWLHELDLAQAELRVAALEAKCQTMLDIISEERDPHGETATSLFETDRDHPDFDFNRQIAKRANFAQPIDEPVLTPNGWVPIGELNIGDRILGANGHDQKVVGIPYEGWCDEYDVVSEGGLTTRCSPGHYWWVQPQDVRCAWRRMQTEDILRSGRRWYVPRNQPIEFDPVDLPVDPYILGALLGDGSYRTVPELRILTSDREIADEMARRCLDRVAEATYASHPNMTRFSFHGGSVYSGLKQLGLVLGYKKPVTGPRKFIPEQYLRGTIQQRIDLLRGLMDTDGFASCGGYESHKGTVGATIKFTNNAPRLVEGVADLVRSLGGKASIRWKPSLNERCRPSGTVSMQLPFNPFHLMRKANRWRPPHFIGRIEIQVRPTGRKTMQRCITVSNADSLYITRDYRVTSNSLIFGSGWKTFRDMIRKESGIQLTQHKAQEIVYGWRDLYPEFGRRIAFWEDFCRDQGYVKLCNGKRRYYQTWEVPHSGFNQVIQGSIAEHAKRWLLFTDRLLYPLRERGVREHIGRGGLLLVVHDSQVLLLPDELADQLCDAVCAEGIRLWDSFFPGVPGEIESKRWKADDADVE